MRKKREVVCETPQTVYLTIGRYFPWKFTFVATQRLGGAFPLIWGLKGRKRHGIENMADQR